MMKRLFDITIATTALIVLSPVYAITAYQSGDTWERQYCSVRRAQAYMASRLR